MDNFFTYQDYRKLLSRLLAQEIPSRGAQSRLADFIVCQQAYISRVIGGDAELSQEQAIAACEFFKLDSLETEFFLHLLNYNRAGSAHLRSFYKKKLDAVINKKLQISERVVAETLHKADQVKYYSDWITSAVHVVTGIEKFRSVKAISGRLRILEERVLRSLEFLENSGLITKNKGNYAIKNPSLHLPKSSELLKTHHANWRIKAIEKLAEESESGFNYTSVLTCSEKDSVKIREIMLEATQKIRSIITSSGDEQIYCMNLDFFEV
jgi:uncharacterized protein (TIGR02147 family)